MIKVNKCKFCLIEFETQYKPRMFCSKTCRDKYQTKYTYQKEFNCLVCNKLFVRTGKRKLTAHFCCNSCRYKWQKLHHVPSKRKGMREGIYKNCEICNKQFYVFPGDTKNRRFCSMECRNKGDLWSSVSGEKHWNWKGGIRTISGYLYTKAPTGHPNLINNKQKLVAIHRLNMEQKLKRCLTDNEEVHHINGIKTDNRIENLSLTIKKMHNGEVRCPHCLKNFKVK